ncbi:hypothetical protein [Subtercola sp. RTI3]|uniref:hypothetical protein n=1 Tax=Subtercola sp. RTI3 TaxID=3048639 RepID=UPI002B2298FB|nr:hypothetical protein [Subtercola sp. RTI3]MEA9986802.1 hypothetical protein [Subtercola sp. RTI3]
MLFAILFNLAILSQLQHYLTQKNLYDTIRVSLAAGSVPIGPVQTNERPWDPGTPLAVLVAPEVGIGHEVIVEGTAAGQTMQGIGHQRDTALPCQAGDSTLMARAASYGGTGTALKGMHAGDVFTITMGEGTCSYQVTGFRNPGDPPPAASTGDQGHLALITGGEGSELFLPTDTVTMDAVLITNSYPRPSARILTNSLYDTEAPMASDTSNLFATVLLLELLAAVTLGTVWLWKRWGRWQAWIVGAPAIAAVFLMTSTSANYLFPNLL